MNLLLMHYLLGDMCSLAKQLVARSKYLATHLSGGGRRGASPYQHYPPFMLWHTLAYLFLQQ